MLKVRIFALLIVALAFALAAAAHFLPIPSQLGPAEASSLRSTVSFLTFLQVITLGITGLFLIGLKGFKTAFKRSYYLICLGQIIGIATAVAVYSGVYISSYTYPEVEVIATIIGFIIALVSAAFTFAGVRHFAYLLRIQPWALSPRIIAPLLVLLMLGVWLFAPSVPIDVSELLFHLQIMPMAAYSLLTFFLGVAILQIKQAAGIRYRRALTWFSAYLFLVSIAVTVSTLSGFTGLSSSLQQGIFLLHIVGIMALVNAGISFNKITRETEKSQLTNASAIDLLTYLASYASNPRDIDIILDDLRAITATGSQSYSTNDMHKLVKLYRGLEDYLTTKEQLRIFTRESLRAMLIERFDTTLVGLFMEESPRIKRKHN